MRYLTIVRHCKASAAHAGESDYERPLTSRGRDQAAQLREWASDAHQLGQYGPTTSLVSAAARTRETFTRAFADTPFVVRHEYSELIYNGRRDVSPEDLLINLATIDPVCTSLLVVAHNPTVLELVLSLASAPPRSLRDGHYPLGGAIVVALPDDQPVGLVRYEVVASFIPD